MIITCKIEIDNALEKIDLNVLKSTIALIYTNKGNILTENNRRFTLMSCAMKWLEEKILYLC